MKTSSIVEKLKTDKNTRTLAMIVVIMIGFILIFLLNNVTSHYEPGTWLYRDARIFPTYPPAGNDFRVGYYRPAYYLIESHFKDIGPNGTYPSNYPPLVALSALPYALFKMTTAYAIHVVILILLNLACLFMAVLMVKHFLLDKLGLSEFTINVILIFLFFLATIYIFSSYFFLYSMERGNTDIIVMFYMMLAMWVLIKRPNNIWLQVILLSVAVHFKIYPIVLFPILLFKHGKKLILPALIVNFAFLFCLGPNMAWHFIQSVLSGGEGAGIGNAWSNVANHASYSFTMGIDMSGGEYLTTTFFVIWAITFLIPLLIWAITAIGIVLKKYSTLNAILFFMVSIPIMALLPTYSIDYRLVIFGVVVVLLIGLILKQFLQKFTWFDLIQMVLLMGVLFMMSRSYAFVDKSLPFIRNKYIWVLLLEVFISVNILRNQKKCYQSEIESIPPNTNG
ncbi:MAG: hypothetical protein C0410_08085 [Anaerolinea sp.]|nr:hypothetical protein [Anaerolinea sp.]